LRIGVEDPGKIWEVTLSGHKKKTSNRKYFDLIFPLSRLVISFTILNLVQKRTTAKFETVSTVQLRYFWLGGILCQLEQRSYFLGPCSLHQSVERGAYGGGYNKTILARGCSASIRPLKVWVVKTISWKSIMPIIENDHDKIRPIG
tara:strand:- start:293 stop:730 length:438 start_codon:yes stop_codon:yes gene_type:complete